MYKRKTQRKKIIITSIIIIMVILLPFSFNYVRKNTKIEMFIKDCTTVISKIVMYPFTSLNKEKNQNLDESYIIQKNVNEALVKEIEELKSSLNLNKTLTEYNPINATILSRNKAYWFNTLTIDKGIKSGIKKDMAVITSNGLVGKISRVSNLSSEIKLITSDDINYKVSVAIKTGDRETYGILNGYDKKNNLIKISGIDRTVNVSKGNEVKTSGLGGIFPGGIYVGQVEKIENNKYDLNKTIYIKTKQDFNSIHYVTILGEKK